MLNKEICRKCNSCNSNRNSYNNIYFDNIWEKNNEVWCIGFVLNEYKKSNDMMVYNSGGYVSIFSDLINFTSCPYLLEQLIVNEIEIK